jgi:hypothetical protein
VNARLLPDGTLLVPMRAEGPDGEIGDGLVPLAPGAPGYERWLAEAIRPGETHAAYMRRRFGVEVAE